MINRPIVSKTGGMQFFENQKSLTPFLNLAGIIAVKDMK